MCEEIVILKKNISSCTRKRFYIYFFFNIPGGPAKETDKREGLGWSLTMRGAALGVILLLYLDRERNVSLSLLCAGTGDGVESSQDRKGGGKRWYSCCCSLSRGKPKAKRRTSFLTNERYTRRRRRSRSRFCVCF